MSTLSGHTSLSHTGPRCTLVDLMIMTKALWIVLVAFLPVMVMGAQTIVLQKEIATLVAPVLNAAAAVAAGETEEKDEVLDKALAPILDSRKYTSTEALTVLLGFYVGEAPAEDISCELVARGKTVLPLLHHYANREIAVPGVSMLLAQRITTEYSVVEARIGSGEHCVREN